MKKVIIVIVVLLLVSMVAYGQESGWREDGSTVRLRQSSDNVSIGTTDPDPEGVKLYVEGNHVTGVGLMKLKGITHAFMTINPSQGNNGGIILSEGSTPKWVFGYKDSGERFRFHNYDIDKEVMTLSSSGYVGIGTTSPDYKLDVNGTIRAKEIKVETGWSDFVFEDNYQLMSLNKLAEHIKKEKSLPGIPTEKEVLEGGVNLGEMQAKLLEKVEELTLYVIELKKENEELKERISALEK